MAIFDLSFDPRDPLFELDGLPGVRWGVQIFTASNLYGLNPERTQVTRQADALTVVCDELSWAGQQQRSPGSAQITVRRQGESVVWTVTANHAEPIKTIKLMLHGLPEAALAQGWWQPTSDQQEVVIPDRVNPMLMRYPWPEWLTPWACAGGTDGSPSVVVSMRDEQVRAKRLYVHLPPYASEKPVVELLFEEDAMRWGRTVTSPEFRLRVCQSRREVDEDFAAHQAFLERSYQLQPWETRSDVPDWMREIRLVLNLHGQHWTGYVFNTFDRMAQTLEFISQHIPGKQVLAYIPGWEGRYYFAYPHYRPGTDMGGEPAFRRLVATADRLGVKLMPMFGMHGANTQVYPDWERSAFRSRTNGYVKLVNFPDWDTDRFGEDDQVFLNPGEPTFRQHLLEQVSAVVRDYGVPGVFLDTSACWFNDPNHNLFAGYQKLVAELHQRHPDVLIAGEGWWDALLGLLPVNQSWLGISKHYRYPQLLTRYGRALGHLSEGAPMPMSTGVHERGYLFQEMPAPTAGHIRALGIVDDTLEKYPHEIERICRLVQE